MTTTTVDAVTLQFDDPDLLRTARAALTAEKEVVISLTGASAQRAATVFLGGDYRLYDGVRTLTAPGAMTVVLSYTGLSDLARVIAMGRLRGHRIDVEYVDRTREFRLSLVPPHASGRRDGALPPIPRPRPASDPAEEWPLLG